MSDDVPCTGFLGKTPAIGRIDKNQSIKILLATDNHIGYAEDDPVRGMDSINAFREILQLAVDHDVDMLLLGGDLFHENKPSRTSLYQTISALREFTMGDRPVEIQVISDEGLGISRNSSWSSVNYEDENINVGLPVFSIHGNHDDPQGTGSEGALCALDILSASGLVNYFGRLELPGSATNDEEAVESGLKIKPVLLQKGTTKLALYGIGNIRDERFHYEMKHGRISLFRPNNDTDDWFNIVLVHQNRHPRGIAAYTADTSFGEEADLVVWGHEHDCIEKAGACEVPGRRYYITQPGSSVATSLSKGEAIPKHVSLLTIQGGKGKEFEMTPIRLKSVRPMVYQEISLATELEKDKALRLDKKAKIVDFLKKIVNEMIEEANADWDENNSDLPESERLLPLIRLKVDYSATVEGMTFDIGNPQRFGQDYVDVVANHRDIILFSMKRKSTTSKVKIDEVDGMEEEVDEDTPEAQKLEISNFVARYLAAQNLSVLPQNILQRAVEDFVDKKDSGAINKAVTRAIAHITKTVTQGDVEEEEEDGDGLVEERITKAGKDYDDKHHPDKKEKGNNDSEEEEEEQADSDDSMATAASEPPKKGKKVVAKKVPVKKPPVKKAVTKGKKKADTSEEEEEASDSDVEVVKKKAPVKKSVAKAAPKKVAVKKAPPKKDSKLFSESEGSSG